jgi:signal peptidase II
MLLPEAIAWAQTERAMWLEPVLSATAVLVADQISKALVAARSAAQAIPDRSFVSIRYMQNRSGHLTFVAGRPALVGLWAATLALAGLLLQQGMLGHGALGPIGVGLAIGGATGNLLDRLRHGAIVDFIAIGPWPVFNLADAAIVCGIALAVLAIM